MSQPPDKPSVSPDQLGSALQPPLPRSFLRPRLEAVGFTGWRTWDELRATNFAEIPCRPGAYVVFRQSAAAPRFIHPSPAGHFKRADPSVSIERLRNREWVPGAHVIYIGKADFRKRRQPIEALRNRLAEFGRFGAGDDKVGHKGGRFIWQLADADELLVLWQVITWREVARSYEKRLLRQFGDLHGGRRPFANLTW